MSTQHKLKNKSAALIELFRKVSKSYNLSELNTVCLKLGIEIEDLSGTNKSDKIRELIKYSIRHGILGNLLEVLEVDRPNISWPFIEDLPQDNPFPFINNITDYRGCFFQFGSFKFTLFFILPALIFTTGLLSSTGLLGNLISAPTPASVIAECSVPAINLTDAPKVLSPGQMVVFSTNNTDTFVYKWSSSAGEFDSPDSAKPVFIAPMDEGPVLITITTSDSCGRELTSEFTLKVEAQSVVAIRTPTTPTVDAGPRLTPTPTDGPPRISTQTPTPSPTNPLPTATSTPLSSPHIVYAGKTLASNYNLGIDTSAGLTNWVTDMGGYMCMNYPDGQDWGALFITYGPPQPPGNRPGQNLTEFDRLYFELKGETTNQTLQVGIKDNTDPDNGIETKFTITPPENWQGYSFRLSDFITADPSNLYVVIEFILGNTKTDICFRNVMYLP